MGTHAIILGDPNGVLALPKAPLRNRGDWQQRDSDILAHFIQVHGQIQQSRWNKSDIGFRVQGDKVLSHSSPEFEDFVFAAVYFRQLIADNDRLLKDAVSRYRRFVDCPIRSHWVKHELDGFNKALARDSIMMSGCTVRELFDAFMYGASLMHKMPAESDPIRKRFLDIYDNKPRHLVTSSLNMSLRGLMNHVGNVAVIVYRDYAHWLHDYGLPLPDTRWHQKLFHLDGASSGPDPIRPCAGGERAGT